MTQQSNAPLNVVNESGAVAAGQTLTPFAGAALAGDSDPDGDMLQVYGVQQSGTTTPTGESVSGTYGELTLYANGYYTYAADNAAAIATAARGAPLIDSFTYLVTDGKGTYATSTLSITVDRRPTVTTSDGTTATHQVTAAIDPGFTLSDVITSANVQVTGNFQPNEDILAFVNTSASLYGDIVESYDNKVLTLSSIGGNATISQWQNALEAVTFEDVALSPNTGDRTVTFTVNDGTLSASATKTVSVVADTGPVISGGKAHSILHDTTLTFSAANGDQLAIVDPNGDSQTVTLSEGHGTLTLATTNGLSFSVGDGTANTTMTFSGSLSAVNGALAGLSYTPGQNLVGADDLLITATDGIKHGVGLIGIDVVPRLTITSPVGLTNQTTPTMTGTVDVASAGSIVVYEGTTPVGSGTVDASGNWQASVFLRGDGVHTLVAEDFLDAGGTAVSAPVTYTLDTKPPVVTITSTDLVTNQPTQTIFGKVDVADAGSTVTVKDGTQALGTATVDGSGNWDTTVTLSGDGLHFLVANDTDAAGNTGSSNTVTYTLDTTPPAITITSAGGLTDQPTQIVSGSAEAADAGTTVTIYDGRQVLGTTRIDGLGDWFANVTLTGDGQHILVAKEIDSTGNTGVSNQVTYTLDTTAPRVAITSAGGNVTNAQQTITGAVDVADAGSTVILTQAARRCRRMGAGRRR